MDSCEIKPEEVFCEKCLARFRELLEMCPKVTAFPSALGLIKVMWGEWPDDVDIPIKMRTHEARLIDMKELK